MKPESLVNYKIILVNGTMALFIKYAETCIPVEREYLENFAINSFNIFSIFFQERPVYLAAAKLFLFLSNALSSLRNISINLALLQNTFLSLGKINSFETYSNSICCTNINFIKK